MNLENQSSDESYEGPFLPITFHFVIHLVFPNFRLEIWDSLMKNSNNFYSDEESGEEKQMKMTKPEAFKWFETKTEFILAELQSSGYRIEPQPLPSLAPLFKKFRDEL